MSCVVSPPHSSTVQSVSASFPKLSVFCYWSMRHLHVLQPATHSVAPVEGLQLLETLEQTLQSSSNQPSKGPAEGFLAPLQLGPGICACVHEACLTVVLSLGLQTSGPAAWWQNLRWKLNPFLIWFLHSLLLLQRVDTTTGITLRHWVGGAFLSPVLSELHRNFTWVGCWDGTFFQLHIRGKFSGRVSSVGCRSRHEPISVTSRRTSKWLGCLSIQRETPLERPFFVPVTATFFWVAHLKRRNDRDRSSTQGGWKEGCPLIQTGAGDLGPTLPSWKMAEWGPAEEGTDFSIRSFTPSGTEKKKETKDEAYFQCDLLNKRQDRGACYKQHWNNFSSNILIIFILCNYLKPLA